jgi:hypothetical protein
MSQHINKRLHAINTLFYNEGDVTLTGIDELGVEFFLTIPVMELLEWINIEDLRAEAIKYINEI